MNKITFLIIGIFVCIGCKARHLTNKSLPIMEIGYQTSTKTVYLPNEYGFLIEWLDNKEPELYIYDKPANKITMTRDFSSFISAIAMFPNGVKVDRIRTCGTSSIGMSEEYKRQLTELIKEKHFRLTDENDGNFGVCVCESNYCRKFTTSNNSARQIITENYR
jgi:hypothetical protein